MYYRDYIYRMCTATNFDDKEDAISLARFLANELMGHHELTLLQEKKLKQLMTAEEFDKFAEECGTELFKNDVGRLPDGDFKEFIEDNMELILKGEA